MSHLRQTAHGAAGCCSKRMCIVRPSSDHVPRQHFLLSRNAYHYLHLEVRTPTTMAQFVPSKNLANEIRIQICNLSLSPRVIMLIQRPNGPDDGIYSKSRLPSSVIACGESCNELRKHYVLLHPGSKLLINPSMDTLVLHLGWFLQPNTLNNIVSLDIKRLGVDSYSMDIVSELLGPIFMAIMRIPHVHIQEFFFDICRGYSLTFDPRDCFKVLNKFPKLESIIVVGGIQLKHEQTGREWLEFPHDLDGIRRKNMQQLLSMMI